MLDIVRSALVVVASIMLAGACGSFEEGGAKAEPDGGLGVEGGAPTGDAGSSGDGPSTPSSPSAAYRDAILADGPVAYWRMGRVESQTLVPDETAKAGPLVLSAVKTGEPGIFDDDPAMAFDGKSAFAEATSSATLQFEGTSAYTIECWVRFEGVVNVGEYFQSIVSFSEGPSGTDQQNGYHLYIRNDTPASMRGWRDSLAASSAQAESPIAPKGSWGHHVMTFDGTTIRMYFDGQPMGTAPMPGSISIRNLAKLTVGRASNDFITYFEGAIDEIAVYPKALDVLTIVKHHDLGRRK